MLLSLPLLGLVGCDEAAQQHAPKVERALDRADQALDRAGQGVKSNYDKARDRVRSVDWVEAFDRTKDRVEQVADDLRAHVPRRPAGSAQEAPADAWWKRGTEAVECSGDRCTVAAWFVTEARSSPTRLIGDVRVLTAPDDSGWLLDRVTEGTAAHAMGFRRGDTVETVAGHPLVDRWARIKVLESLRNEPTVDVVYRRGDQRHTLTIVFERPTDGD